MMKRKKLSRLAVGTIHESSKSGKFTVISYVNTTNITIQFHDTGSTRKVRASNIDSTQIRDLFKPIIAGVGYFGEGRCKGRCSAHNRWRAMLERCHDELNIYYIETDTVNPEWHNFQTFAAWYHSECERIGLNPERNQHRVRLMDGQTEYGPKTAELISIISPNSKVWEFMSPEGETITVPSLHDFCNKNGLAYHQMRNLYLGNVTKYKGYTKVKSNEEV